MGAEVKQFAVIGLGRFGMSLCKELSEQGAQVLAIDIDEVSVKKAAEVAAQAVVADCSNEETVAELQLESYDVVMVSIGDDLNASILTTLVLKDAGVKSVWVKAKDKYHAKILNKIGANKVITPEQDMGIRVARSMLDARIFEYLDLGSGLALVEVIVSFHHLGRHLNEHPCCSTDDCTLLALKRGSEILKNPEPETTLETGDILLIVGPEEKLNTVLKRL